MQLGRAEVCHVAPGRKRGRPSKAAKTLSDHSSKQQRPDTYGPASGAGAPLPHNVAAGGEGHGADDQQLFLLKTLVTMLADDMRNVKRQNMELRAEVSKLRAYRKQSTQRIRQLERLQEQNANHISNLIAHITSTSTSTSTSSPSPFTPTSTSTSTSTLPSTIPAQSAGSLSSSYQQTKAVPFSFPQPPAQFSSSVGLDTGSPFSRATSVFQALPFLRDYSGARLIITDTSQAFVVLRSVKQMDHPVISYCSPSAGTLLGYWPEELMNRPVTDIGRPDVDAIAVLMVEIQRRPPPGRVGPAFTTSFTWQRKSGEGCRIQCQHQNLWPGPPGLPQTKWHLVRLDRVVEDGLPVPAPQDVASLMHDLLLQSLARAKPIVRRSASSLLPAVPTAPVAPISVEAQQAADQGQVDNAGFDRREDQLPQHQSWDENGDLLSAVGEEELGNNTLDLDELVADMLRSPPDSGNGGQLFSSLADDTGFA